MQMGTTYLKGKWKVIRKIRVVRLIRKLIEEGIMVRGVKEMYEEGCRILSEMERGVYGGGGGGEGEENEEEKGYLYELYLLKVRGMQKKITEDEVTVLRREVEEEKRKREEAEKELVEETHKREEGEQRMKEEKERREAIELEKRELEKKMNRLTAELEFLKGSKEEEEKRKSEEDEKKLNHITSLDGTSLIFPHSDGIKREGNTIIHHGPDSRRNCFIGGVMTSV